MLVTVKYVFCWICLLGLSLPAFAATPSGLSPAFERLYSFDFAASRRLAGEYSLRHAADPMGYAVQAAACLYAELDRLNALASPISEQKVKSAALRADPNIREAFWRAAGESRKLAQARLLVQKDDRDALLALSITYGLQRDWLALVDKRLRESLDSIRLAHATALRLLALDPNAHDAYLNTGFTEYLLGSMPFFLRWVVKVDGVEGDRQKGFDQMETAAKSGSVMKPLAQLMLASFYKKEGRTRDSERLLRALLSEYPENQVVRRELMLLTSPPPPSAP